MAQSYRLVPQQGKRRLAIPSPGAHSAVLTLLVSGRPLGRTCHVHSTTRMRRRSVIFNS